MIKLRTFLAVLLVSSGGYFGQPCRAADSLVLRVGVTPITAPMVYKEGGKIVGIEADFAAAIGAELGRTVTFVEVNWEDQITALTDGRTDIIMSSMSITRPRQLRISFAKPYLAIGQMPLVRREDSYRYAMGFPVRPQGVVGVWKATTGDFLVQQEFPSAKRKEFKSPELATKALLKKQIDLFICDSPVVWWQAGMHEAGGLFAVPILLSEEPLAWGLRKSDAQLLDSVNSALDKLQKNGRAAGIIKHWIPLYK
jgi:ABC-type amino acid transport substrate-binding protein